MREEIKRRTNCHGYCKRAHICRDKFLAACISGISLTISKKEKKRKKKKKKKRKRKRKRKRKKKKKKKKTKKIKNKRRIRLFVRAREASGRAAAVCFKVAKVFIMFLSATR
jgi:hypothetical protein